MTVAIPDQPAATSEPTAEPITESDQRVITTMPCPACGRNVEWIGNRTEPGQATRWSIDCDCPEGNPR